MGIEFFLWKYGIQIIMLWTIIEHWGQPHGF